MKQSSSSHRCDAGTWQTLTDAGLVPVQMLGREVIEIVLKAAVRIQAKIMQECPGIDPGAVHVVETDPYRVVSNGIDGKNGHMALAADSLPLCFRVTLHFCRRTGDPKQLSGQDMTAPVIERDRE